MTRTLRVMADPTAGNMARSLRAAAKMSPLLVLTARAFTDLAAELGGGHDGALRFLLGLAEADHKPIAVNFETGPDTSSTAFIAPRSWTEERLAGWIAGHHQELEAEFGAVTRVGAAWSLQE